MKQELVEYARGRRDSKKESAFAQRLRKLPEDERFALIWECLQHQTVLGLSLATSCLQKPIYFQQILEHGLQRADASSIRSWLECAAPKLGFRRVIAILTRTLETDPQAVEQALYWIPRLLPPNDSQAWEAWEILNATMRFTELTATATS